MATVDDAVLAIRHVVQDHSDEGTQLGSPADAEAMHWFGRLLGWVWPPSYVQLLSRHNGVVVQDAIVLGFLVSIELLLQHRESWHREGYWPVAGDGCGNYYALAVGRRIASGECPIVFLDTAADTDDSPPEIASSYANFVIGKMRQQCERLDCAALAEACDPADGGG